MLPLLLLTDQKLNEIMQLFLIVRFLFVFPLYPPYPHTEARKQVYRSGNIYTSDQPLLFRFMSVEYQHS